MSLALIFLLLSEALVGLAVLCLAIGFSVLWLVELVKEWRWERRQRKEGRRDG